MDVANPLPTFEIYKNAEVTIEFYKCGIKLKGAHVLMQFARWAAINW